MTLSKSGSGSISDTKVRRQPEFTRWSEIHTAEHDQASVSWFGENEAVPLSKYLSDLGETTSTLTIIKHWLKRYFEPDEVRVPPKLIIDIDILGDPIPLPESQMGREIIAALKKQKVNWGFAPLVSDYVKELDLANPGAEDNCEIILWETFDEQVSSYASIKILKNKRGNETPLVFAPMLIGSRPMHHITKWWVRDSQTNDVEFDQVPPLDLGKVLNIGEWPEQIAQLPLMKRLIYEGEKGVSGATTRGEVFPHLEPKELPTPLVFHMVNQRVTGTWQNDNGDPVTTSEIFPHVVYAGWKLNESVPKKLGKTLSTLIPAVKRMQLILSDGFESHKIGFANTSWDLSTLAPAIMLADSLPGDRNGSGFWVPSIWAALISAQTRGLDARIHDPSTLEPARRTAVVDAASFGIGLSAFSAINTFAFSYLIGEQDFSLAERILELSYLADAPFESTNSLSNWGICCYVQNDFERAKTKFAEALSREDHFADAEAYTYLAEIARAEGNETLHAELKQRCEDAGGYSSAVLDRLEVSDASASSWENQDSPSLTKSSDASIGSPTLTRDSATNVVRANYCSQCGGAFANTNDNFCAQCGSRRA